MRNKLITFFFALLFIFIFSCVEKHRDNISFGKQLKSVLINYVDTAQGLESCLIMSANRLFNANQYKEGFLIGPMYREIFEEMPYLRPVFLFTHSATTIYIDSAIVSKIPFVYFKDTLPNYVNQPPKTGALFDYVKRAVFFDISYENEQEITVLNADTLFLPMIKEDEPLLDEPHDNNNSSQT